MNTSQAEVIKKCRNDLQKERIVKSVLCGMAVGFSMLFVVAFVTWIFEFKGLWLSIGLGAAAWVGATLLFYFVLFSFTDMEIMKRIDRAGLDERMITMYELQSDNSYLAQRQREDASAAFDTAVKTSGGHLIKTKIATAIICVASIVGTFGAGMAVVTGLSDYGVIPTLYELFTDDSYGLGLGHGSTVPTYTVTYKVGGDNDGGTILVSSDSDSATDKVKKGGASSARAIIAAGYYIEKWEDEKGVEYYPENVGYQPTRFFIDNVQKNMTVTVVFAKYENVDDLGFSYYYNPNDNPDNNNPDSPDPGNEGNNGGLGNEPPPSPGSTGGGSPAEEGNSIVDGETDYRENYDEFYALAMDMLANGTDGYPPELVAMIEAYFGILL